MRQIAVTIFDVNIY